MILFNNKSLPIFFVSILMCVFLANFIEFEPTQYSDSIVSENNVRVIPSSPVSIFEIEKKTASIEEIQTAYLKTIETSELAKSNRELTNEEADKIALELAERLNQQQQEFMREEGIDEEEILALDEMEMDFEDPEVSIVYADNEEELQEMMESYQDQMQAIQDEESQEVYSFDEY